MTTQALLDPGPVGCLAGTVTISDRVILQGNGNDTLWYWSGLDTEESALSTDDNHFGWGGAKVSGDTMSYADLIALWDNFTGAGAVPGWTVTKADLGASQDAGYHLFSYKFVPSGVGTGGSFDRTVFIVAGQHGDEWGPPLATWRFFYHAATGRVKLPPYMRYVVVPCANPWGWEQLPRDRYEVRGSARGE